MRLGKKIRLVFALFIASGSLLAQSSSPRPLVSGDGIEITKEELETAAEERLQNLVLERERFEAEMAKKRQDALEETLAEMIRQELLTREAESRGSTVDEVVQQVTSPIGEPTQEEVENFWEENQSRIKGSKEQVFPQIRNYLERQNKQNALNEFLDDLKEKYGVTSRLEPLRFDVSAEGFPTTGPEDAPVTIVEFSDFQCPYCSRVGPALKKVKEQYGEKVQLVFRHFPLTNIHRDAQKAAEASMCAADQGKFWAMHDLMFDNQAKLSTSDLKEHAGVIGLDEEVFSECLDSGKYAEFVQQDARDAMKVGVTGTPAFFVNGRPLSGAVPFEAIAEVVEEELDRTE